jgi:hypothetical protein
MARKRLGLLLVMMTACRSTGSTPSDAAGGAGGQSGAGGIDASGGTSGSGGGGSGDSGTDVRPPDAPADSGARDMGADISVIPACGAGSTCQMLRAQYADAVLRGQSCTVGTANVCAQAVPSNLGCIDCPVWVNDDGPLAPLRAQFAAAGCDNCFYGNPAGERCHPLICPDLFNGVCRAGDGGQATCVINSPPAECPVGTAGGQACPIPAWYCTTQGQPRQTCGCGSGPIPPGQQPDARPAPTWTCRL